MLMALDKESESLPAGLERDTIRTAVYSSAARISRYLGEARRRMVGRVAQAFFRTSIRSCSARNAARASAPSSRSTGSPRRAHSSPRRWPGNSRAGGRLSLRASGLQGQIGHRRLHAAGSMRDAG